MFGLKPVSYAEPSQKRPQSVHLSALPRCRSFWLLALAAPGKDRVRTTQWSAKSRDALLLAAQHAQNERATPTNQRSIASHASILQSHHRRAHRRQQTWGYCA